MSTESSTANRWFWSSDAAPPSQRWEETGRPEEAPKSSRRPVQVCRETPRGFFVGSPNVMVIFKRELDRTEAAPLTYREYVYLLPRVAEEQAREFLLAQLAIVQATMGSASGKLVRLAVCDAVIAGKAGGLPIATLTWKDWHPDPVIGFPRSDETAPLSLP